MIFGFLVDITGYFFLRLIKFRGVKVGYEEGEIGVKVDQVLIVYGKLVIEDLKSFKFSIEKP